MSPTLSASSNEQIRDSELGRIVFDFVKAEIGREPKNGVLFIFLERGGAAMRCNHAILQLQVHCVLWAG